MSHLKMDMEIGVLVVLDMEVVEHVVLEMELGTDPLDV